jgi:hypothetical protein
VLKSLDLLSEPDNMNLASMQPKLAQVYGRQGSWDQIIVDEMELPASLPSLIREMWSRNQEIAKAKGLILTPQQFAEMFVDQNLACR